MDEIGNLFHGFAVALTLPNLGFMLVGILLGVAVKMSEYRIFMKMFRAPKSDISVMVGTFLLTVLLDLTIAIPTGMVMASFLFMRRMEQVSGAGIIDQNDLIDDEDERQDRKSVV